MTEDAQPLLREAAIAWEAHKAATSHGGPQVLWEDAGSWIAGYLAALEMIYDTNVRMAVSPRKCTICEQPIMEWGGGALNDNGWRHIEPPANGGKWYNHPATPFVRFNDDFGHDGMINALFTAYDALVRWEEHDSRLDAVEPVLERAAARGHIVAFIANTAYGMGTEEHRGGA